MLKESMNVKGKIIGLILGLFFGPMWMVVGLVIGHFYDVGAFDHLLSAWGIERHNRNTQTTSQIFFDVTFSIMGYIAKSDGRITETEIHAARQVMAHLGLSPSAKERAMRSFYQGKRGDFDLQQTLQLLRQACAYRPMLLRTFVEYQLHIAYSEGSLSPQKRQVLQTIYQALGIRGFNFYDSEAQARAQQNYEYHYRNHDQTQSSQYRSHNQLNDAYKILGISEAADKEAVTKAYRKQMSQHHPDKLIAKGLPPEMIKIANQKTAQIKKAYETIKQVKGW